MNKQTVSQQTFLQRHLDRIQKALNNPGVLNDLLTLAEKNTGVDRIYLAPGAIGFLAVYLVFGFGAQLICNLIGFIYPAYASIKAIESRQKDDDTKWLTYWVVYGCFTTVEFFSDLLLSWFPLYWLGKCTFLIFCFAPTTWNGSKIIYESVIRPVFLNYEPEIDEAVDSWVDRTTKLASALKPQLTDFQSKVTEMAKSEQFC